MIQKLTAEADDVSYVALLNNRGAASVLEMSKEGKVALTPAKLSMLLEGIDWRVQQRTWRPLAAG